MAVPLYSKWIWHINKSPSVIEEIFPPAIAFKCCLGSMALRQRSSDVMEQILYSVVLLDRCLWGEKLKKGAIKCLIQFPEKTGLNSPQIRLIKVAQGRAEPEARDL